jgi:hypothetical protein
VLNQISDLRFAHGVPSLIQSTRANPGLRSRSNTPAIAIHARNAIGKDVHLGVMAQQQIAPPLEAGRNRLAALEEGEGRFLSLLRTATFTWPRSFDIFVRRIR